MAAQPALPPVPIEGVSLEALRAFLAECGGRSAVEGLSTGAVCARFVQPQTAADGCSWVTLRTPTAPPDWFGRANVFISHAWGSTFLDLYDAIEAWAAEHSTAAALAGDDAVAGSSAPPRPLFWLDTLVNSQHGTADRPFEWWTTVFLENVRSIGHTVLVLDYETVLPLTRAWCLWEVASTLAVGARFTVVMAPRQRAPFTRELLSDFDALVRRTCSVDVSRAQATVPADRDRILSAAAETVGLEAINARVIGALKAWMEAAGAIALEDARRSCGMASAGIGAAASGGASAAGSFAASTSAAGGAGAGAAPVPADSAVVPAAAATPIAAIQLARGLSALLRSHGRLAESRDLAERALADAEAVLGPDHSVTLACANNLGVSVHALGALDAAEALYRRALAGREALLGPRHVASLSSVHDLAMVLHASGRLEEAAALYARAYEGRVAELGPRAPDTLAALHNSAVLAQARGNLAGALPMFTEALAGRREVLGTHDPATLNSLDDTARLLHDLGRLDEAEPLSAEALAGRRRVLGPRHPDTLSSLHSCASLLEARGRLHDAAALLEEDVAASVALLGWEHVDSLSSSTSLARLLLRMHEEASALAGDGPDDGDGPAADDRPGHGGVFAGSGPVGGAGAAPFAPRGTARDPPVVLFRSTSDASTCGSTASAGAHGGAVTGAVALLHAASSGGASTGSVHIARSDTGAESVRSSTETVSFAGSSGSSGRYGGRAQVLARAEDLAGRALDAAVRTLRPGHSVQLSAMYQLARVRLAQGRLLEALQLMRADVAGSIATLGASHPETLASQHALGLALLKLAEKVVRDGATATLLPEGTSRGAAASLLRSAPGDEPPVAGAWPLIRAASCSSDPLPPSAVSVSRTTSTLTSTSISTPGPLETAPAAASAAATMRALETAAAAAAAEAMSVAASGRVVAEAESGLPLPPPVTPGASAADIRAEAADCLRAAARGRAAKLGPAHSLSLSAALDLAALLTDEEEAAADAEAVVGDPADSDHRVSGHDATLSGSSEPDSRVVPRSGSGAGLGVDVDDDVDDDDDDDDDAPLPSRPISDRCAEAMGLFRNVIAVLHRMDENATAKAAAAPSASAGAASAAPSAAVGPTAAAEAAVAAPSAAPSAPVPVAAPTTPVSSSTAARSLSADGHGERVERLLMESGAHAGLGRLHAASREWRTAAAAFERAASIRTEALGYGQEDRQVALCWHQAGLAHVEAGELGAAQSSFEKALNAWEASCDTGIPEESLEYCETAHELVSVMLQVRRSEPRADGSSDWGAGELIEHLARKAFEGRADALGRSHPDAVASVFLWATAAVEIGEPRNALEACFDAMVSTRAKYGEDSILALAALHGHAAVTHAAGDAEEAIPMYRQAAEGRAAVLGPAHEATLASLTGLAIALTEAGQAGEAVTVLTAARSQLLLLAADSESHSKGGSCATPAATAAVERQGRGRSAAVAAATVAHALGAAYRAEGRPADAENAYRAALAERRALHGPAAEETTATAFELAYLLKAEGRMAEGRAVFAEAVAGLRENGGLARALQLAAEMRAEEERHETLRRYREQMAARATAARAAGSSAAAASAASPFSPFSPLSSTVSASVSWALSPAPAAAAIPASASAADTDTRGVGRATSAAFSASASASETHSSSRSDQAPATP